MSPEPFLSPIEAGDVADEPSDGTEPAAAPEREPEPTRPGERRGRHARGASGPARARPLGRPRREPPEASVLLRAVRDERFPAETWFFGDEVRNTTGAAGDVLRFADALALKLVPAWGWHLEGVEVKRALDDLDDELRHPEKSAPFRLHCRKWWLVVPFLIRDGVLRRLHRIPNAWGVLVVDGHRIEVLREALDRREAELEPPTAGLIKSLLRSRHAESPNAVGDVPLFEVARALEGQAVLLECGDVVDRPPLAKGRDGKRPKVPCVLCAERKRREKSGLAAAITFIRSAGPEALDAIEAAIHARRAAA